MPSPNILRFNEVTGLVLSALYQSFPIPIELRPTTIGLRELNTNEQEFVGMALVITAPDDADPMFFCHTVNWLIATGYISAVSRMQSIHFSDAVLTAKGLEVLNAVPKSLSSKEPIGQQLAAASKSGAMEAIRTITTEALAIGVRTVASSFGLPTSS